MNGAKIVFTGDANTNGILKKAIGYWAQSCQALNSASPAVESGTTNTNNSNSDWSVIRFAFWISVSCFVLAAGAICADRWFLNLIQRYLVMPSRRNLGIFLIGTACAFYLITVMYQQQRQQQQLWAMQEAFLLLSTASLLGSFYCFDQASSQHYTTSLNFLLFGLYTAMSLHQGSNLVWAMALVAMTSWLTSFLHMTSRTTQPIMALDSHSYSN
jgi:hypothetical protein